MSVEFQEHVSGHESGALVPVLVGVVSHDFLREVRGELEDVFLASVVIQVHGRVDCGLEQVGLGWDCVGRNDGCMKALHLGHGQKANVGWHLR